tara:strand:- start:2050 stop:3813 length:1764 start_codon:yes stop_codon:yes gene_type:complete
MAVSNLPNLSVAAPRSAGKISPQSMSGGQTLGSGVVESAANNIAGFKRAGTSTVAPRVPNIAALLQSISSNIISNVENITGGVKNVIQGGITNVTNVFGRKEAEEDPNKIMSEFLGLYQKALDYIKFFADPKQIQGFDKAIELYQDSLKSTGDTVVTIRKFVKKMIKDFLKLKNELANMGGGGFQLPRLPLPGRGQQRQPRRPRPRTRMPRGRRGKLGLGLLGLGLLGGGLAAGSRFIGGNEEKQQSADGISKELITKFDGVLDKFDEAISTLESLASSAASGEGDPKKVKPGDGKDGEDEGRAGSYEIDPSRFGDGVYGTGLVTGPEGMIGAGTEYHLDTKFSKDTSLEDRIKLLDQLAKGYAARGREIEFSNDAVAGTVYDPNASLEEKTALLKKVHAAHSHSSHADYDSIDYYIPEISDEKGRRGKSAEGAEILMPTMQDAQLRYGQSRGYGAFVDMVDKDGKIIMTTGHGDVRGARTGTVDLSPSRPAQPTVEPVQEVKPDPKAQEVSLSNPAATNFIQQQPGSNNIAMIPLPSESKPPQRSSSPPPATTPSTVQNIDFNLSVHNPDNASVILTHQMLNVAVG